MTLSELLAKRLILISGKGGVGKTTISLALALTAARMKKNTLLVEMNSTERVAPYFGEKAIGHEETPLAPYLTGINLKPASCFEEYVLLQIRFKGIFNVFINNRFVSYFLNAVPGFNDLLMTGKIYHLESQKKSKISRKHQYDIIIVDGPATGHGLSAFHVPKIVRDVVHVGPLRRQSERILKLFSDREKSAFCIVTLPEEMPVSESLELISRVKENLDIGLGPLFLNKFYPPPFRKEEILKINDQKISTEDSLYPYFKIARYVVKRAELHRFYEEELRKKTDEMEIIKIPHSEKPFTCFNDLDFISKSWAEKTQ